jgi:uncharacterized short protein YbdD (DUF466 family)
MSTERLHLLKIFASLSAKLMKYIKKLTVQKQDQTLMTKEEFFAKVDKSLEQARQGRVHRMQQGESLDDFLRRVG